MQKMRTPQNAGSRNSRRNRAVRWLPLFAMLCACSVAAQQPGQDDLTGQSMEELVKLKVDSVYGAAKFLQKVEDAATSITVVTAEEIQKHEYRTLADVLRGVRGFYVINDRNYSYVGVRGLSLPGDYNARILFLLDGHRVNDNIFDGAYVGTEFPVDIDLIERIEIIRGPDSSAYGTGAFAAVINVITKRGRDLSALEFSGEAMGSLKTPTATSLTAYLATSSTGISISMSLEVPARNTFPPPPSARFSTIHGTKRRMLADTSMPSTTTRSDPGRRLGGSPTIGTAITESTCTTMQAKEFHRSPKITTPPMEPGGISRAMFPGPFSNDTRSRSARNSGRISGSGN
jgi:TonB-dependent Receptor Plug Domain